MNRAGRTGRNPAITIMEDQVPMNRRVAIAGIVCLALCLASSPRPLPAADLKAAIDEIIKAPAVAKLHGGVCVYELTTGKSLYSLHPDDTFIPASNAKLLTTAAALDQLGADFSFTTTFALRGDDLLAFASGDPGLGDERLAKKHSTTIDAPFLAVAAALKKSGVTKIAGDLVVDATVFDADYFHANWPVDQREKWYQAEVSGFNFNDNCIDLRCAPGAAEGQPAVVELIPATRYVKIVNKTKTGPPAAKQPVILYHREGLTNTITASGKVVARVADPFPVPITNPPAFAAQTLADVLAAQGIAIAGKIRFERLRNKDGSLPEGLTVLYRHEQNLGELVWRANTYSQNFVAECLFKALGAYDGKSANPTATGSWKTGQAAVAAFIARQKLPAPAGLVIDDGSGISKSNQVSPALLGELLVRMAGHKAAKPWMESLASAGEDGTLHKRFRDLPAGQSVLAKTGTLANAVSLSGYVKAKDGKQYVFSILFDKLKGFNDRAAVREASDQIVGTLLGEE
jgi:D-alanyl-D-alanine carboxypeptidase/D-alanyl-D-alanine-endopeptidase (penicillin-binding protein 4)